VFESNQSGIETNDAFVQALNRHYPFESNQSGIETHPYFLSVHREYGLNRTRVELKLTLAEELRELEKV